MHGIEPVQILVLIFEAIYIYVDRFCFRSSEHSYVHRLI